jgi:hypothetical protein
MKYYVYYDAYGHARKVVNEKELAENYRNEPDRFLKAMCGLEPDTDGGHISGHVGTLNFLNDEELNDYLDSLGDEISGFYKADSDSRPYNF